MKRSLSVRVRSVANSVILTIAVALAILVMPASQADARDIYVDPARPAAGADGSSANPWHSLDAVFENETLEPGDTVYLRSGDYGGLWINQRRNEATVTIAADRGHVPRFGAIRISASSHWHLRGLSVSPAYGKPDARGIMLKIDRNAEAITVEDCTLMSAPDSSSWSIEDWNTKAYRGIFAQGTRITLRGNRLRNVSHGISMWAAHSLVENNVIENFSGDGMRGLGDHTTFRSNTVKNCYNVNDNHDDGFQSWSVGATASPGPGRSWASSSAATGSSTMRIPNSRFAAPCRASDCSTASMSTG